MRPSESLSSKDQHARRSNFLHQPSKSTPKNSRFFLTGSLNRLPLSKHFHHTSTAHHLMDDHIQPKKPYLKHTGYVKRKKIPQSYLDYARQNESPALSDKQSIRSQSSTVQHHPSSILLDRLQHSNTFEKIKDQHIQSNACDKSTVHVSILLILQLMIEGIISVIMEAYHFRFSVVIMVYMKKRKKKLDLIKSIGAWKKTKAQKIH